MALGRIKGPVKEKPFANLQVNPIGVVPKKTQGSYRLIQHLSYPDNSSNKDRISSDLSTVTYTSFDDAVKLLLAIGQGSFMAKTNIGNAFSLIPILPVRS